MRADVPEAGHIELKSAAADPALSTPVETAIASMGRAGNGLPQMSLYPSVLNLLPLYPFPNVQARRTFCHFTQRFARLEA
jgi:hypothetical protein